jgi:hypothetical protein
LFHVEHESALNSHVGVKGVEEDDFSGWSVGTDSRLPMVADSRFPDDQMRLPIPDSQIPDNSPQFIRLLHDLHAYM